MNFDDLAPYGAIASVMSLLLVVAIPTYKYRSQIIAFFGRTTRVLGGFVTWRRIAALLAIALCVIIFWPPASYYLHDYHKDNEREKELRIQALDAMRTRPTCSEDCSNLSWKLNKCVNEAREEGVVATNRLGDVLKFSAYQAMKYFRGCLVDKGLGWERCNEGEEGCLLLGHVRRRW